MPTTTETKTSTASKTTTAPNTDSAEIHKFERMASRWWDLQGEFKPLHDINPIRANYIDNIANVAEKRILDVGCGGGILSESLAQRGAQVYGLDMGDAPLEVARLHALESGLDINYIKSTAEEYAEKNPETFDVICCLEMLEHVPDPASVIRACARLAKPGGLLFFSTINRSAKGYAVAILGAEYLLKLLPKGTHEYKKFIKPAELAQSVRDAELIVNDISGIRYNPLTKHYKLSSNDVDVNYLMAAEKPVL
ncbi:MAG: 2-polyprenyl-6-hydroxyphenyl methylase/3-demethylubiquinone-9 3-methyltransferase [Flavobacteriales bacterium]|jgi:2-polyprenyl-6-hydroxyphenyl methylase/3-demethylubiquinone-9 3-methyltransferase